MKVQGLAISVYRSKRIGDCTNGGVSSRFDELILIGDGIEGPCVVDLENPPENVVKLVKRKLFGREPEHLHVEPLDGSNNGGGKWYMCGGNICFTSDSRFPHDYPLKIHDRYEG